MTGESFHDIDFVVMREATIRGRDGRKASLASCGRHGDSGGF